MTITLIVIIGLIIVGIFLILFNLKAILSWIMGPNPNVPNAQNQIQGQVSPIVTTSYSSTSVRYGTGFGARIGEKLVGALIFLLTACVVVFLLWPAIVAIGRSVGRTLHPVTVNASTRPDWPIIHEEVLDSLSSNSWVRIQKGLVEDTWADIQGIERAYCYATFGNEPPPPSSSVWEGEYPGKVHVIVPNTRLTGPGGIQGTKLWFISKEDRPGKLVIQKKSKGQFGG